MRSGGPNLRTLRTAAGLLAAGALGVKGLQEPRGGAGWAMIAVAVLLVVALYLRTVHFRD